MPQTLDPTPLRAFNIAPPLILFGAVSAVSSIPRSPSSSETAASELDTQAAEILSVQLGRFLLGMVYSTTLIFL